MQVKEKYEQHEVWTTAKKLAGLQELSELEDVQLRHYAKYIANDVLGRKERTNYFLVSSKTMDNLNSYLDAAISYTPSSPDTVRDYIDNAVELLASKWPALNGRQTVDIATITFDSMMNEVVEELNAAKEAVDQIEKLKETYASDSKQLEAKLQEFVDKAETSIDSIEETSETRAESILDTFEKNNAEAKSKADAWLESHKAEYDGRMEVTVAEAEETLAKVQKRANSISGWVIADNYGKYARNKTAAYIVYDALAVLFALFGIAVVAFAVATVAMDGASATVFRLAVSVASFTVSGFLFKRGTYNTREARAAKRTELTLRQYESFIANLGEDEKKRITEEIAERVFIKGELDDLQPTLAEALINRGLSDDQLKIILDIVGATKTVMKAEID